MNMKRLIVLFALLVPMLASWAQEESSTPIKTITEVKQSKDKYLYADQTYTTVDQALTPANEQLMQEVKDYFQMMGMDFEAVKEEVASNMVTITMQRGDQFRAFVYIDKSIFDEKADPQTAQEGEQQPSEKPEIQETATDAPAESQSVTVKVPAEDQSANAASDVLTSILATQIVKYSMFYDAFAEMIAMDSRLQVYDYVNLLHADGLPISFVNQPQKEDMNGMFLLVYRRGGDIEALLTPVDANGDRYNMRTGELDALKNHPKTSYNGIKIE